MVVWDHPFILGFGLFSLALLMLGSGIHIATNVPGETLFEVGPVDGVPGCHHTTTRASKIISTFTVFRFKMWIVQEVCFTQSVPPQKMKWNVRGLFSKQNPKRFRDFIPWPGPYDSPDPFLNPPRSFILQTSPFGLSTKKKWHPINPLHWKP